MNATLQRRLAALEAAAGQSATADTPEARAAREALEALFQQHDADGGMRTRFDAAPDSRARAVAVVDLLEIAGPEAERRFLNLLAVAEGRQPCYVNAPESKDS